MELAERAQRIVIKDKTKVFNTARVEALELDNLIETAQATDRLGGGAQGERAARTTARDYPEARRRELDEAHAVVQRRQPPRLQAGAT